MSSVKFQLGNSTRGRQRSSKDWIDVRNRCIELIAQEQIALEKAEDLSDVKLSQGMLRAYRNILLMEEIEDAHQD